MSTAKRETSLTMWRGLNDRRDVSNLAPGEFADCRNVELYQEGNSGPRNGFQRLHSKPLRLASLRFDGVNDYVRIRNITAYQPTGTQVPYIGLRVVLHTRPTSGSAVTVLSWGYGAVGNLNWDLRYDPAAGTGSLGAWIFRIRDAGGATTKTLTLDDGDGNLLPQGLERYLEVYESGSNIVFSMWDHSATNTTTSTTKPTSNWNSAWDLFVGVGTTAANTIGTDFSAVSVAELRYSKNTRLTVDSTNKFYERGLPDEIIATLDGYWRFDDGWTRPEVTDSSSNGNNALIVNNPAEWVLKADDPNVIGKSALRFNGGSGWIHVYESSGTKLSETFTASAPNVSCWTVRIAIELPTLPQGLTTFPDMPIFWMGTSATVPAPVGLRVVSDRFEAKFDDNGATRTVTLNGAGHPTVTSLAGKRMRLAVYRTRFSGTGNVTLGLGVDNGNGTTTGYFNSAACTSNNSGTPNANIAIGRHVSDFAQAALGLAAGFVTANSFIGVVDDFQIVHTNSTAANPVGLAGASAGSGTSNNLLAFQEISNWNAQFGTNVHTTIHYLRLNDGAGSFLQTEGSDTSDTVGGGWRAYLRPDGDSGAWWNVGLVEPYRPARGLLSADFIRYQADGKKVASHLVAAGCTLYKYDSTNGMIPVDTLRGTGEALTIAQYQNKVIISGMTSRRPMVYDGAALIPLGIKAPSAPAIVTVSNTVPGAFVAGSYYLYYTYRDKNTGSESNPSPGILVAFAAGNDTIDQLQLALSPDPQVNQRRVYMTAVSGADGDTAYLVATIDDNTTGTYTTDIVGPVSTSASSISATSGYYDHGEAPACTVVAQFKDYTFLGGNQTFPTRAYYSAVGRQDYWDQRINGKYLDLDQDAGKGIVKFDALRDELMADVGDLNGGKWGIFATGNSSVPFDKRRLNDTHGAVGPHASIVVDNQQWYIGQTDFFVSDGTRESNVSSPQSAPDTAPVYIQQLGKTSIQNTIRSKVDYSYRTRFCVGEYRSKGQIWFCVRTSDAPSYLTGTNDAAFIYDIDGQKWSRYDIPIDCMSQSAVVTGSFVPVAVVQGFLVQLDVSGYKDGSNAPRAGTVVSSTTGTGYTEIAMGIQNPPLGLDSFRHARCFIYKQAGTVTEARMSRYVSSGTIRIDTVVSGITSGDYVIFAVAPFYIDLMLLFGSQMTVKRLMSIAPNLLLGSDDSSAILRFQAKGDIRSIPSDLSSYDSRVLSITNTFVMRALMMGGIGTCFYLRVSEVGLSTVTGSGVFPGGKQFKLLGLNLEAEEVKVRSRS